jgi:hypothetical protein
MSQVSDYTSYQNSTQRMQDSYDTERTETRANHEKEVKKLKEETSDELENAKKDYNKRLEAEREQARDEVRKLKDDLYDKSGKASAKDFKEEQNVRNTLNRYKDEIQTQADQKVSKAEDRTGELAMKSQKVEDTKIQAALDAQNKSHFTELNALNDELSQYRNGDRDVESDRAKARYQSINENEKAYLEDKQRIVDGYSTEINSMKNHEGQMAQHYDRQLTSAVFDSNKQAQDQIRNQKNEFSEIQRQSNHERDNLGRAFEAEVKDLKNRQNSSANHLIEKNNVDRNMISTNKDHTYQDYIATKDAKFDADIKERDSKIQELRTTGDPMKVSPYVVKRINDKADERNFKVLNETQKVYNNNLDATKSRDSEDRRVLSDQYSKQVTGLHRESRKEIDGQNRQFRDSYADLQNLRETEVANLKEQKRGSTESMYQKHAVEMAGAQTDKQEALLEQRDTLNYQKSAALDDAQQSQRNQDREWFMKANDLRRGFEAKLAEERDTHEKTTTEMRLEFDKKYRDQDRTSKRAIDDRVRAYEHQITQQELAFKEKERFLTEHYEEELDRMKRTNAHLIQKKS